jgi:hypothetical protein
MPFFITEDKGKVETRIEKLFAKREDGRPLAQPFASFRYPEFVEYPQFDLSISFVQNRFWGRTKVADFTDTISPGMLKGYLQPNQSFIGNYEFKLLDLRSFDVDGRRIMEYQPEFSPPRIILRRDIQKLDVNPRFFGTTRLGVPLDDRDSQYARVEFSLETPVSIPESTSIYLVGDFNNWMINDLNRMTYNEEAELWKGHALVKQGEYGYKYVLVKNNRINDLSLDQGFLSAQQEYLTLIYFKDPKRKFDRLLKMGRIIQR